jgi:NAD(P)-dependent dehydrogenase (short-subunit alcohol dehydrogenase family)
LEEVKMNTSRQFEGKIAIVTGSTQGLGEATARLLAERGAAGIVITGRDQTRGEAVAASLNGASCRTVFIPADMASVDDCRALIAATDETFGTVHVLVNSAGATTRGSILNTTPDVFDQVMAVNVRAPFFLVQETAKIMIREGVAGSMVNIGSVSAYGGMPFLSPYSISKGALAVMTKNAAYSLMRHRIRVNALNIGWMDTPGEDTIQRTVHGSDDGWLAAVEAKQPFGRLLKAGEVAKAIAFLASDESGMMTGAAVEFDQSVQGGGPQPIPPPLDEWDDLGWNV